MRALRRNPYPKQQYKPSIVTSRESSGKFHHKPNNPMKLSMTFTDSDAVEYAVQTYALSVHPHSLASRRDLEDKISARLSQWIESHETVTIEIDLVECAAKVVSLK